MHQPRTTIRRLMAVVLLLGIAIWACLAAIRTRTNRARFPSHYRLLGDPNDTQWEIVVTPEWVPFWPVYWRTLLGLRWDWHLECVSGVRRREVACDHDLPQMVVHDDTGRSTGYNSKMLRDVVERLKPSRP